LLLVLGSIDPQIYFLNLIVYEMPYGKRKEIFETFRVGVDIFPDLSSAKK
jgi:hypothetical protein